MHGGGRGGMDKRRRYEVLTYIVNTDFRLTMPNWEEKLNAKGSNLMESSYCVFIFFLMEVEPTKK